MQFINLGTRNKGTFWEYLSAYSFKNGKLSDSHFSIEMFLGIGEGIANKHCHESSIIKRNSKIFQKEFKAGVYSEKYFENLIEGYTKDFKKIKKAFFNRDFSRFSTEELSDFFIMSIDALAAPNLPMLQALYTLFENEFFDKELHKVLTKEEKKDKGLINETKSFLLTNIQLSITDKEEEALYNLRKSFRSFDNIEKFFKDKKIKAKIESLAKEYGWFHMEYAQMPLSTKDYEDHLRETILDSSLRNSPRKNKEEIIRRKKEFFSKHKESNVLYKLTDVLQKFAYILDHTKAVVVEGRYVSLPLFKEIASRLGVSDSELLFLVPPEIISLILSETKADKSVIKRRFEARAVLLRNNFISWFGGEAALKMSEKYIEKAKAEESEIIKGLSAYPGKLQGKAVIVRSIEDREKFKKGDILVTHDGSAELTVFLKEAGAIVTDEGGIICHAAIVAREMKTPCVVGTKFATKLIKDNDIIEVDANRGIVRKIR